MYKDLVKITSVTMFNGVGTEPCWIDHIHWDVISTMVRAIQNAAPNVKAMTFRPSIKRIDDQIREACAKKDITVVWAKPPDFIRYTDGT